MAQILRPALVFRARSKVVYRVNKFELKLPPDRGLTDWDEFKLTWREDPLWPRKFYNADSELDPYYDSWAAVLEVVLSADNAVVTVTEGAGEVDVLDFPLSPGDLDLPGGAERYALDVRGLGGVADETVLRDPTAVTLLPRIG